MQSLRLTKGTLTTPDSQWIYLTFPDHLGTSRRFRNRSSRPYLTWRIKRGV